MTPHAQDTEIWVDWIRKVCDPSIYLDIGAGDGFDCGEVQKAFPGCRCIAIEPHEEWYEGLSVEMHRDVIGAANDYRVFYVKQVAGIHGLYSRRDKPNETVRALPVRALDHFCEREGIKSIDAMKIDVEGAAWDVLAGAEGIIPTVQAIHVETEWITLFDEQRLEPEVFGLLSHYGMRKVWENRVEDLGQGDSIWVRQ